MLRLTRQRILGLLIATAGILALLLLWPPAGAEWLAGPPPARKPRLAFLSGWLAPVRAQWQRLKYRFVGAPVPISVSAVVFETTRDVDFGDPPNSRLVLSNQLNSRVWVLGIGDLDQTRAQLPRVSHVLASPVLWASDGMPAIISVGGSPAGPPAIQLNMLARARGRELEMATFLSICQTPGVTNVALGARWRMGDGEGALFLVPDKTDTNKVLGLLLAPVIQSRRR